MKKIKRLSSVDGFKYAKINEIVDAFNSHQEEHDKDPEIESQEIMKSTMEEIKGRVHKVAEVEEIELPKETKAEDLAREITNIFLFMVSEKSWRFTNAQKKVEALLSKKPLDEPIEVSEKSGQMRTDKIFTQCECCAEAGDCVEVNELYLCSDCIDEFAEEFNSNS